MHLHFPQKQSWKKKSKWRTATTNAVMACMRQLHQFFLTQTYVPLVKVQMCYGLETCWSFSFEICFAFLFVFMNLKFLQKRTFQDLRNLMIKKMSRLTVNLNITLMAELEHNPNLRLNPTWTLLAGEFIYALTISKTDKTILV